MKRRSDGVNKEKWIHWVTIRDKSITFLLIARATINWKEKISPKNEVALEDVADFHWDSTFKLISLEVKKIEISNSWNITMIYSGSFKGNVGMRQRISNFRKQNQDYWRAKKALYWGN